MDIAELSTLAWQNHKLFSKDEKLQAFFGTSYPFICEPKIVNFSCILGVIHWQTPCVPLLYFCYRYAKVEDFSKEIAKPQDLDGPKFTIFFVALK